MYERVLKILKKAENYLMEDCLVPTIEKCDKRYSKLVKKTGISPYDDKSLQNLLEKKEHFKSRKLNNSKDIYSLLITLRFTSNIPDNIKPLLSPFGTFCDRRNFYYIKDLEKENDEILSYIIFCEFFNAFQDYYYSGRLGELRATEIASSSLLMMYHIGIVKEKLWYGTSNRISLLERAQEKYPYNRFSKYIFKPNAKACKYLYDKMIEDRNVSNKLGHLAEKATTMNVVEYKLSLQYLKLWSNNIKFDVVSRGTIFLDINEQSRKLTRRNKIVKEHRELVDMVEKLGG